MPDSAGLIGQWRDFWGRFVAGQGGALSLGGLRVDLGPLSRALAGALAGLRRLLAPGLAPPAGPNSPAGIPALPAGLREVSPALAGVDAATAIQQAIDGLGPNGGVVRLPPGRFELGRPIALRSNVHLVGVSGQTVLAARAPGAMLTVHQVSNVSVRQLVLDGGGIGHNGVRGSQSQGVGVYACEIKHMSGSGGWGAGTGLMFDAEVTDARIIGNHLHHLGSPSDEWPSGIRLAWGSSRAVVTDNVIEHVSRVGIAANDGSKDLYVARNTVRQLNGRERLAIELWKDCSGIVEQNRVSSWISFDSTRGAIRNNEVDGSWDGQRNWVGLEVVGSDGVQVVGNRVRNVGMGLSIDRSSRTHVEGNTFEQVDTGVQGFGAKAPARENVLVGNVFRGTGNGGDMSRGIFLNQNCDGWRLEQNRVEGFSNAGIFVHASQQPVKVDNVVTGR